MGKTLRDLRDIPITRLSGVTPRLEERLGMLDAPSVLDPAEDSQRLPDMGFRSLVVAFQPHLVSRTRLLGVQMGEELGAADRVVVLDPMHDMHAARATADESVRPLVSTLVSPVLLRRSQHLAPTLEADHA